MAIAISLLALAVGLAMDAFAAALAQGAASRPGWRDSLKVAAAFGFAQAAMPLLGWGLGIAFAPVIRSIDHWLALVLLGILGLRMIRAGLADTPSDDAPARTLTVAAIGSMAVATSIDAAVAGITLPLIGAPVVLSVAAIGFVTCALSVVGMRMGAIAGARVGKMAEVAGGLVLLLLGVKIFVQHQFLGG